jgi:predicted glutamine amidotransferase
MCTFFVKKPKQVLKQEHFNTIIENNPQGFGFVYTTGTKLVIVKSAKPDAKVLWNKYQDAVSKYPQSHFIGHGRIATGSNVDYENTHPFLVNKGLVFVHNGIIRQFPSTAKRSDTYQYMEQVLRKLPRDFYKQRAIMDLIGRDIVGSKFAFLTIDNKVYIVNEHACVTDKETGVLFSNSNYMPSLWLDYGGTKVYKTETSKYNKYSYDWDKGATQSKLDFHIDRDSAQIQQETSDYIHCQDCDDWVYKTSFEKKFDCCTSCAKSYGYLTLSGAETGQFEQEIEGLNICDECSTNIASHKYDGFHLCSHCEKMYTGATPIDAEIDAYNNSFNNQENI